MIDQATRRGPMTPTDLEDDTHDDGFALGGAGLIPSAAEERMAGVTIEGADLIEHFRRAAKAVRDMGGVSGAVSVNFYSDTDETAAEFAPTLEFRVTAINPDRR